MWAPDCYLIGKFIRKVKSKKDECGVLCAADLNCNLFTWDPNGNCVLTMGPKEAPEAHKSLTKGGMCGYISEGNSNFRWHDINGLEKYSYGCDLPGNDIRTVNQHRNTSCYSVCISEPKCTSYVKHMGSGNCYLKAGKSPIARTIYNNDIKKYSSIISARI